MDLYQCGDDTVVQEKPPDVKKRDLKFVGPVGAPDSIFLAPTRSPKFKLFSLLINFKIHLNEY